MRSAVTTLLIIALAVSLVAAQDRPPQGGSKQPQGPPQMPKAVGELKTAAQFERKAKFVDLILAPDSSCLYVLDTTSNKVCKLRADDLALAAEVDAIEGATALALTPDGKTLYVGADARKGTSTVTERGAFQVISAAKFQQTATFRVDAPVNDMDVTDSGLILVAGCEEKRDNRFFAVDVAQKKVLATINVTQQGTGRGSTTANPHVHLHPGQDWAWYSGDYSFIRIGLQKGSRFDTWETARCHGRPLGEDFAISHDGKWVVGVMGSIFKMPPSGDGLEYHGRIDFSKAIAFWTGTKYVITSSEEGKFRLYDIEEIRIKLTGAFPFAPLQLVVDAKRQRLLAIAIDKESLSVVAYTLPSP